MMVCLPVSSFPPHLHTQTHTLTRSVTHPQLSLADLSFSLYQAGGRTAVQHEQLHLSIRPSESDLQRV